MSTFQSVVAQNRRARELLSKLAYIASMTLALEAMTAVTSQWTDSGGQDLRIEAAMAKLFSTEAAWKVIDETMQFRGGRGYERADF